MAKSSAQFSRSRHITYGVAVALGLSLSGCHWDQDPSELVDLERALLAQLDVRWSPAPRFTGATAAGSCFRDPDMPTRPRLAFQMAEDGRRPAARPLKTVIRRAQTGAARWPQQPESLKVKALVLLLSARGPEDRSRALALFQLALEWQQGSPERLNDLAAAYLLQADFDRRPANLITALELSDQALALRQGSFPEAAVNRALALQSLGLWPDASKAWEQILTAQAWQQPARSCRALLPVPTPAPRGPWPHHNLREQGEDLLGRWGTLLESGKPDAAAASLARASSLARGLAQSQGDHLLFDAVAAIERAAAGSPGRLGNLARGHATFHRLRGKQPYSLCRKEILERTSSDFAQGQSPFRAWVEIDRAICAYFDKNLSQAAYRLEGVQAGASGRSYFALEGRAHWLLGLTRMVQARFLEADREFSSAIEQFGRLQEIGYVVYLHSQRAKNFEQMGLREQAWQERYPALLQRLRVSDSERVYNILADTAQALRRQGHGRAALFFLSEQIRVAGEQLEATGAVDLLAYALLDRAALRAEFALPQAGTADLRRAEALWRSLPVDHESRARLRRELDVEEALQSPRASHLAALAAIDRALAFFAGTSKEPGDQVEILKLYNARAQTNLQRHHFDAAEADLRRGIEEAEHQRRNVDEPDLRARFLTRERRLYEEMIRLQMEVRKDPLAALSYAEQMGSRQLSENPKLPRGTNVQPLSLTRLARVAPAGTLLVRYGHLPDRLLIWTWLDGRLELEQHPLSATELREQVEHFRATILLPGSGQEVRNGGAHLAHLVLPRRLTQVPAGGRVVLVPDEILLPLPFAALPVGSNNSSFLVERFSLSFAPSLASYIQDQRAPREPSAPQAKGILLVSNPRFRSDLFPTLSPLPAADRSLADLAALYPDSKVIYGIAATRSAILAALPGHRIFQFDGHSLTYPAEPDKGGLVLATEGSEKTALEISLLRPADLRDVDLHGLELVILAACRTSLTPYPETAEAAGLATAFLAHGAPQVLTAAWDVEDSKTALLLERFHDALARGASAETALRKAQLQFIRSPDVRLAQPRAWAAFQIFRHGDGNSQIKAVYSKE